MEENKSLKYKSPNRAAGFLFTLFCLAGAAGSLWLFWSDINRVMIKNSEQPVGTVSYKHHTVQRRFEDRLFWSQLPRESPVYNGDLIRTAELSDAVLHFVSEDSISLMENSLVHILYDEATGAPRIELLNGEVNLSSPSGRTVILSGGQEMRPNAGGSLTVRRSADSTDVLITAGTAEISGSGEVYTLEAGSAAAAGAGGPLQTTGNSLMVLSPGPEEELQAGSEPLQVRFSWTNSAPQEPVRLEIASNRRFSNIIHTVDEYGVSETSVPLGPGTWWWRILQAGEEGAPVSERSGRLTILRAPDPVTETEEPEVRLSSPLVLAALSAEMPVSAFRLQPAPAPLPALESPAIRTEGVNISTPARGVQYLAPPLMPRPAGLFPPDGMVIDGAFLKASPRLIFSWNMTEEADAYICTIRQGEMVNIQLTREPHLLFDQLTTLRNGECVWQVEAIQLAADGSIQRHGELAESRFTISVPKPEAPQINNPGIIYGR
jgi:hypothetical protein